MDAPNQAPLLGGDQGVGLFDARLMNSINNAEQTLI